LVRVDATQERGQIQNFLREKIKNTGWLNRETPTNV